MASNEPEDRSQEQKNKEAAIRSTMEQLKKDVDTWDSAMKAYVRPLVMIPTSVWLVIVPVWAYGMWFFYKIGLYYEFRLPIGLISFQPAGMASTVAVIGGILAAITMVAVGIVAASYRLNPPLIERLLSGGDPKKKESYTQALAGCDSESPQYFVTLLKLMRAFASSPLPRHARMWRFFPVWIPLIVFMFSMLLSFFAGVVTAYQRTNYFIVVQTGAPAGEVRCLAVVLDEQESRLICYTLDVALTPGIVVLPYPDGHETCLRMQNLGRYAIWSGRLKQDLSTGTPKLDAAGGGQRP